MLKAIAKLIFALSGWKVDENVPKEAQRSIMIAAPHTTNWDFWYMRLGFIVLQIPVRFTIKMEWIKSPLGWLIKALGGIGIDRRPKNPNEPRKSYTEAMKEIFDQHQQIAIVVTPEGTRKLRTKWKTGFYYTALAANVPITFGYLDYKKKVAGVGGFVHPTGDFEADMRKISAFYQKINGKYPELFSVDERFKMAN